jgi:hypothetical protein
MTGVWRLDSTHGLMDHDPIKNSYPWYLQVWNGSLVAKMSSLSKLHYYIVLCTSHASYTKFVEPHILHPIELCWTGLFRQGRVDPTNVMATGNADCC